MNVFYMVPRHRRVQVYRYRAPLVRPRTRRMAKRGVSNVVWGCMVCTIRYVPFRGWKPIAVYKWNGSAWTALVAAPGENVREEAKGWTG